MNISIKSFEALTKDELYALLQLRNEIFVVEQDCVYQDIDGKDRKAFHLLGEDNGTLIAYTRIFKGGDYFEHAAMGRIAVKEGFRNYGYGHEVVKASIAFIRETLNENTIVLSAQQYLVKFYESHGFKQEGEVYLEDGIPHIKMVKICSIISKSNANTNGK